MKKIRIQGLVKHANMIRDELRRPVSPVRLGQLESEVKKSLTQLEKIFRETKTTSKQLPAQSRKAYEFLSNIEFNSIQTSEQAPSQRYRPKSVSFSRVKAYFESALDRLSKNMTEADCNDLLRSITYSSNMIEKQMISKGIEPEHLTDASRNIRGWLAYFSQKNNLTRYIKTIKMAKNIFSDYLESNRDIIIHFCPLKALYRTRDYSDSILVKLPTSMILFDEILFVTLAEMIFRKNNHKKILLKAIQSEPHQSILQDIELLGGIIERTKGIYFDLEKSFRRVNQRYFDGTMQKPKIAWSGTFNCRKFGHFDHAHDIVMINSSLDRPNISTYTVDFIMYHELLHKKLGIRGSGQNFISHDGEFRRMEKLFEEYEEAKKQLSSLARK